MKVHVRHGPKFSGNEKGNFEFAGDTDQADDTHTTG